MDLLDSYYKSTNDCWKEILFCSAIFGAFYVHTKEEKNSSLHDYPLLDRIMDFGAASFTAVGAIYGAPIFVPYITKYIIEFYFLLNELR